MKTVLTIIMAVSMYANGAYHSATDGVNAYIWCETIDGMIDTDAIIEPLEGSDVHMADRQDGYGWTITCPNVYFEVERIGGVLKVYGVFDEICTDHRRHYCHATSARWGELDDSAWLWWETNSYFEPAGTIMRADHNMDRLLVAFCRSWLNGVNFTDFALLFN